ncbi:MAG: hypothetical protein AAGD33_13490 [Actinomycetota bacterium]
MDVTVSTLAERPDLIDRVWDMPDRWDEFMDHDPIGESLFGSVVRSYRHLAVVATDPADRIVAHGTAMAFRLDRDGRRELPARGWDQALVWAHQDLLRGTDPDFSTSGPVHVPGDLVPVHCDCAHGVAVYVEPNVWVRHDLAENRAAGRDRPPVKMGA